MAGNMRVLSMCRSQCVEFGYFASLLIARISSDCVNKEDLPRSSRSQSMDQQLRVSACSSSSGVSVNNTNPPPPPTLPLLLSDILDEGLEDMTYQLKYNAQTSTPLSRSCFGYNLKCSTDLLIIPSRRSGAKTEENLVMNLYSSGTDICRQYAMRTGMCATLNGCKMGIVLNVSSGKYCVIEAVPMNLISAVATASILSRVCLVSRVDTLVSTPACLSNHSTLVIIHAQRSLDNDYTVCALLLYKFCVENAEYWKSDGLDGYVGRNAANDKVIQWLERSTLATCGTVMSVGKLASGLLEKLDSRIQKYSVDQMCKQMSTSCDKECLKKVFTDPNVIEVERCLKVTDFTCRSIRGSLALISTQFYGCFAALCMLKSVVNVDTLV